MSQLQVTKITTVDNTTPLILATGNAGGGQIIIQSANTDIMFSGNINFSNQFTGDGSGIYIPSSNVANAAFDTANAAYASANNVAPQVTPAFNTANGAFNTANAAFASANNVGPQIAPTYNTANAAFAKANAALPNVSNAVFAGDLRVTGNLLIGMNTVTIRDNHIISAEYYRMNTANHMVAIPDGNRVNTIFSLVNVSYDTANSAFATINADYTFTNSAYASINSNWTVTNALYSVANSAYGLANTKFSSSGGTISGAVEITADLTVHGNTRFVDQQTLQVGDPLIYLAANNYASDVVDIGFVANYVNATSSNVHTGLFRSSGTKEYYLFQGYDREPLNNYIDPTGNNITMAVLNSTVRTSNLILGGANALGTISASFNTTNAAYGFANSAYASINSNWTVTNTVYGVANAVYAASNSNWTVTNTVYSVANAAYITTNSAFNSTNAAYNTTNAAFDKANSAASSALHTMYVDYDGNLIYNITNKANTSNINIKTYALNIIASNINMFTITGDQLTANVL